MNLNPKTTFKICIIDDENKTRQLIANMIQHFHLPMEIVLYPDASSVSEGWELINSVSPDLVLLDIRLSDGSGFDLLALFPQRDFHVVFITAHETYALQAIKNAAVDYLLKPIDTDELQNAIIKSFSRRLAKSASTDLSGDNNAKEEILFLKTAESIYRVKLGEVIRCEAEKNYTTFYLSDGRKILTSKTIKEYEEVLKEPLFYRSHRSHIINMHFFDYYNKQYDGSIMMKDGSEVPLARSNKKDFLKYLG